MYACLVGRQKEKEEGEGGGRREDWKSKKRASAFPDFHFSFAYKANAFLHKLRGRYYITFSLKKSIFSASAGKADEKYYILCSWGLRAPRCPEKRTFPSSSVFLSLPLPRPWSSWSSFMRLSPWPSAQMCVEATPGGGRPMGTAGTSAPTATWELAAVESSLVPSVPPPS